MGREAIFPSSLPKGKRISWPDVKSCARAKWVLPRCSHFHASRMRRTVWKDLEIMEANENKRKLGGFHCFVFKFRLFWRVFDQLNLLRYCGIKVNGSKEQPSRFLQVQLISVWLIRYNHCKLIKLTFSVPFTKNGIFKLTKCGLSPKRFLYSTQCNTDYG